jgi:hypothetical protein
LIKAPTCRIHAASVEIKVKAEAQRMADAASAGAKRLAAR